MAIFVKLRQNRHFETLALLFEMSILTSKKFLNISTLIKSKVCESLQKISSLQKAMSFFNHDAIREKKFESDGALLVPLQIGI